MSDAEIVAAARALAKEIKGTERGWPSYRSAAIAALAAAEAVRA